MTEARRSSLAHGSLRVLVSCKGIEPNETRELPTLDKISAVSSDIHPPSTLISGRGIPASARHRRNAVNTLHIVSTFVSVKCNQRKAGNSGWSGREDYWKSGNRKMGDWSNKFNVLTLVK